MRSRSRATRRLYGLGLAMPTHELTPLHRERSATRTTSSFNVAALPSSVDLSADDPAVGNQGQVNSCASWATGYTLLGWYAHHYGVAGTPYAPMYVYSQVTGGANVGTSFEANFGVEQQGIDTQADYAQGNYDYWDQPTAAERANASHYHITGYTQIYAQGLGNAQQTIEGAMAAGTPVAIGIPVYSNFMYATPAAPYVDVPPSGSTLFGGHAVVAVKYDANGLWVQNQWGASWGLNGFAELSWAFVSQYVFGAYTISGLQGPGASTATSTPSATPTNSAHLSVSPASGLPGTTLTINGSGFGAGTVTISWNGAPVIQLSTSNGSFSFSAGLSSTAAPGPRAVSAVNSATGQQANTTFIVLAPGGATATPSPTATRSQPSSTPTAMPATNTPTKSPPPAPTNTPTATATATPTSQTGTANLSVVPGSVAPGGSISISGSGFRPSETIIVYWNGNFITALADSTSGSFSYRMAVPASASLGSSSVKASGAMGDQASAAFTIAAAGGQTATPSPTASPVRPTSTPTQPVTPPSPTTAPTQPALSPTPTPSGIPTSGSTSNGCQITSLSGQAEAQLIALLNQHRAAAGVPPLTLNPALSVVSRTHSCDMYLHQQMSHTGSDGSSPFQRMAAGGFSMPPYGQEGENIGMASGPAPSDAVTLIDNSMMAEPLTPGDHHWNIVNAGYTIVGVGIIVANGQTWLTEDFAG